jgi:hypothetical protein
MKNKAIVCVQCEKEFFLNGSEQKYLASKGFDEPTHCPECRKNKSKRGENPGRKKHNGKRKSFRYQDEYEE